MVAAFVHRRVLNTEFLSRCGVAFMLTYYQAWVGAQGSIAIVAGDERGDLLGALLGATDPATHARALVRQDELCIGPALVAYAIAHPGLAKDSDRQLRSPLRPPGDWADRSPIARSGRVVIRPGRPSYSRRGHPLVRAARPSRSGIGRALIDAAVETARLAGVDELVSVTPPDLVVRNSYKRLGWLADDEMPSRKGGGHISGAGFSRPPVYPRVPFGAGIR